MKARIQKIISNSGFCSRRKAEEFISEGNVFVNGEPARIGQVADPEKDEIRVGRTLIKEQKNLYLLLHKPKGYVCTLSTSEGKRAVDLVPFQERLFTVGRLDKDASGIIILTNDGSFANKVMHPRNRIGKRYFVKLDRVFDKNLRDQVSRGIRLKDCIAKGDISGVSGRSLYLTLYQGQNKIVKRLFKRLGYNVDSLARVQIGSIRLDVKEGRWRHLKKIEVDSLLK